MKIKTHKDQIRKMVEEILEEEAGNVPSRAVVRICELFKDFETADIEMITLSRRAYQRQLEESKQAGIVMGKQEARNGLDSGQLTEVLKEMQERGTSFLNAVMKIRRVI